jgi:hypothetical protein
MLPSVRPPPAPAVTTSLSSSYDFAATFTQTRTRFSKLARFANTMRTCIPLCLQLMLLLFCSATHFFMSCVRTHE